VSSKGVFVSTTIASTIDQLDATPRDPFFMAVPSFVCSKWLYFHSFSINGERRLQMTE